MTAEEIDGGAADEDPRPLSVWRAELWLVWLVWLVPSVLVGTSTNISSPASQSGNTAHDIK